MSFHLIKVLLPVGWWWGLLVAYWCSYCSWEGPMKSRDHRSIIWLHHSLTPTPTPATLNCSQPMGVQERLPVKRHLKWALEDGDFDGWGQRTEFIRLWVNWAMAWDPAGGEKKIYVRTELGKESKMGHARQLGWQEGLWTDSWKTWTCLLKARWQTQHLVKAAIVPACS